MKRKVKKRLKQQAAKESGNVSAIELLEECVHVLRTNMFDTLPAYALGTIPFVLGMIYFISDMSQRSDALDVLPTAATTMTALLLWKNAWQSIFLRRVMDKLTLREPEKASFMDFFRIFIHQGIVQSLWLFVQIVSLLIFLPIAWTTAFFASFAVYSGEPETKFSEALKSASRHSFLYPSQNHVMLFSLFIASFLLCLNVAALIFIVPWALKTFFGIETLFSKANGLEIIVNMVFNTTFWSVVFGLCYLAVDPLLKTAYAVRIFHADSVHKGYDIIAALKRLGAMPMKTILIFATCSLCVSNTIAEQTAAASPEPERIDSKRMESAMKKVLSKREYTWRLPPEPERASKENAFIAFLKGIGKTLTNWKNAFEELMRKLFQQPPSDPTMSTFQNIMAWFGANALRLALILTVVILLLTLLIIRKRRKLAAQAAIELSDDAMNSKETPDLNDESITADSMEHNEWLTLAAEMLRKGELRLAMRAFFLATIATLAEHDYLIIAKHKTNMDYSREVARRLHSKTEAVNAFRENVSMFERAWYGEHAVDSATIALFECNQQKIGEQCCF